MNTSTFDWTCKHTWKTSAKNTMWCVIGCSIGDFGTILFFQLSKISFPILLIILAAKNENTAVPTIDNDVGNVASDAIGEIFNPTIPLIKTVIGGAVKENI